MVYMDTSSSWIQAGLYGYKLFDVIVQATYSARGIWQLYPRV